MPVLSYLRNLVGRYFLTTPDKKNTFDHHFFDHKYYVNQTSSIENFAQLLNISTEEVDHISKSYHGVDFTILIYQYRHQFLIKEIENPINYNLSIESVIKLCGFENIESFYHSLKSKNIITH